MSNTPRAQQLWSTVFDDATRYIRLSEVDSRYVTGYSWWDSDGTGRTTRIQLDSFIRKWTFVPEPDKWAGGAA